MRVLVLGGPRFLGRGITDAALERGHEVAFFNRGRTEPHAYPEVEKLRGERAGDLEPLAGRTWDAVVDTSGYLPRDVARSARALAASGFYCFVSSVSVYADMSLPADEDSAVAQLGDLPEDDVTNESYGALKALCEGAVRDVFDGRAAIVRPGLIVGPRDPTGRFTYWPHRVARGGEVLAPGPPARPTQFIDVRDLGAWIVGLYERGVGGVFNATHPGYAFGELLDACRSVVEVEATVTWVTDAFLLEQGVGQWMELPLWIAEPELAAADRVDVGRALAEGLSFRALAETIRGTLDDAAVTDAAGLAPEREQELLAAWHAR